MNVMSISIVNVNIIVLTQHTIDTLEKKLISNLDGKKLLIILDNNNAEYSYFIYTL